MIKKTQWTIIIEQWIFIGIQNAIYELCERVDNLQWEIDLSRFEWRLIILLMEFELKKKMKRNIRIILLCNLDGTEKNDYFFFICNGVRFHCHWLASSNSMFCIYKYASALWGVAWIWTVKALEEYRFVQFSWNCVWYLPSEVLKNWGKWIISNNYRHSRVKRVLTNSIYRHCQLNST